MLRQTHGHQGGREEGADTKEKPCTGGAPLACVPHPSAPRLWEPGGHRDVHGQ